MGKVIELFSSSPSKIKSEFKEMLTKKYGDIIKDLDDDVINKIQREYAESIISVTEKLFELGDVFKEFTKDVTEKEGSILLACVIVDFVAELIEALKIEKKLPTDDELVLLYDRVLALELEKKLQATVERVMDDVAGEAVQEE